MQNATSAGSWLLLLALGACTSNASDVDGACAVDSDPQLQCASGFIGYSCNDGARPDENGEFVDGVPQGIVCTDQGVLQSSGGTGFCCTSETTPCVYDPVAGCVAPTYGYQCLGSDRPEAFDPSLYCGEGVQEADLIEYCCGAQPLPHGCQQATGATCAETLVPWTCTDQTLPTEAELGANQSRADFNLLVCSIPTVVMAATTTTNYCCFTPTSVSLEASCLFDTTVPGCAPGSFGFACTGPDTPAQDYAGISCPDDVGVAGVNPQGYRASLYCCQYQSVDGG
ncbi:MAG: hypothetical protein ABSF69_22610 [Polyangiaceae bacterium]|jgi:hypothetical protein